MFLVGEIILAIIAEQIRRNDMTDKEWVTLQRVRAGHVLDDTVVRDDDMVRVTLHCRGRAVDGIVLPTNVDKIEMRSIRNDDMIVRYGDRWHEQWIRTDVDNIEMKSMCLETEEEKPIEPLDTMEKADIFVKRLPELDKAYLYKVLNFNGMNLNHADSVIRKSKDKK
jgi:hypothetical protein